MIETTHIKKMVEHILRRQRGVADREAMDPGREWLIGVVVTILLVVCGGLVSYGLYLNTISLEVNVDHVPGVVIPYNASVVDGVVAKFRSRADTYTSIRGDDGESVVEVLPPTESVEAPAAVPDEEPVSVEAGTDIADEVPVAEEPVIAEPADETDVPELEV